VLLCVSTTCSLNKDYHIILPHLMWCRHPLFQSGLAFHRSWLVFYKYWLGTCLDPHSVAGMLLCTGQHMHHLNYAMSSPISTVMDNCVQADTTPTIYQIPTYPGQLSLATPSVNNWNEYPWKHDTLASYQCCCSASSCLHMTATEMEISTTLWKP